MLLGNSNLWLNLRKIQINSLLLIGQLELFITKNRLYPVLCFKRYCFQLSPMITHCKFDPRVLGHLYIRNIVSKEVDFVKSELSAQIEVLKQSNVDLVKYLSESPMLCFFLCSQNKTSDR
jgi:hypothetical protein